MCYHIIILKTLYRKPSYLYLIDYSIICSFIFLNLHTMTPYYFLWILTLSSVDNSNTEILCRVSKFR